MLQKILIIFMTLLILSSCGKNANNSSNKKHLINITISSEQGLNIPIGITEQLTAIGTYSDGSILDISNNVVWTSSAPNIASVNSNGVLTGLSVGTSNITASLNNIISNQLSANVNSSSLTNITISSEQGLNIPIGITEQLTAIGTYSNGVSLDITNDVVWVSSAPNIASINSNGILTGLSAGTSNITASLNNINSNQLVATITLAVLTNITISSEQGLNIPIGITEQLTAIGAYSNGSILDISNDVVWASSVPSIASISTAGIITGLSIGSSNITASLNNISSNQLVATITSAALTSITISSQGLNIPVGGTNQLTALGTYSNSSTLDISNDVEWLSSAPNVASVNSNGVLTAISSGLTNITASVNSIISNQLIINVRENYAYVTNLASGSVSKCIIASDGSLNNCNIAGSGFSQPEGIAINAGYIYIANNQSNTVSKCMIGSDNNLSNCAPTGSNFTQPQGVTINGVYAYIVNFNQTIAKCTVSSDGSLNNCTLTGSNLSQPAAIQIYSGYAYITNQSTNNITKCAVAVDGSLNDCTIAGGSGFDKPYGIATNNGYIYVTNFNGPAGALKCTVGATGFLSNCINSGGFLTNQTGITFRNNYAYISNPIGNKVAKCTVMSSGDLTSCEQTGNNFSSAWFIAFY